MDIGDQFYECEPAETIYNMHYAGGYTYYDMMHNFYKIDYIREEML